MKILIVILFNAFAYATIVLRPKLYDVKLFKPMIKNFKLSITPIFILIASIVSFVLFRMIYVHSGNRIFDFIGITLGVLGLILWILMLPNSSYLVTELNLTHRDMDENEVPIWYDIVSVLSFAMSGVFNTVVNILLIQYMVIIVFDPDVLTKVHYAIMLGSAVVFNLLAAVGVYLGRYVRFYSWDILKPKKFIGILKEHFSVEGSVKNFISFIVFHTIFFTLVYMLFI